RAGRERSSGPGELLLDLRRQRERDAGDGRQLLRARFADAPEAPEAPEQRPPPPRADARDRVEPRAEPGAGAELSVIEVHEAVRLVAHALEEEERARVGLQHHGVLPPRQEDALGPAADLARRRVAMSRHSMRLGALPRRRRACSSAAMRSPCLVASRRSAKLWRALSRAISTRRSLSPRWGIRSVTFLPRRSLRYSARTSASEIATGRRISSGTSWLAAW